MNKFKMAFAVLGLIGLSLTVGFFAGWNMAYPASYNDGARFGYNAALSDVANLLQQKGVTLDWQQFPNGTYQLTVKTLDGQTAQFMVTANLYLEWKDRTGRVLTYRGAGTFTNTGKNWTETMLTNNATSLLVGQTGGYYNASYPLSGTFYLGDATTAGSSATSQVQPTETQLDGMGRAASTATLQIPSIGTVLANVTKTCTTAGITVAEWGLYYQVYSATDTSRANSLIAYDSTPGSKNLAVGDTLAEGWTITFT